MQDRWWCSFISMNYFQSQKPQVSYADPPEPLPSKTVQPPLNTGVIGEKKKNETFIWQVLSERESGCWELLKGLECCRLFQGDRSAVRVRTRQAGIFNKTQFIAWWLPPPIYTIWDHEKHGTYFLTPGNTKSTEQPCDKLVLFMHFYFVFLNLYFQTSVT